MTADPADDPAAAPSLRDHLAAALHSADPTLSERLTHDAGAHLELVALARAARTETDVLLAAAVASARGAGCTWEQVGAVLGMTRQAAQQRYGRPASAEAPVEPSRRVLQPLTAFNEMAVLTRAGRYGWHSVGFGVLMHVVERDDRQWEHARTSLGGRPGGSGWERVAGSWGWWTYWTRPLDAPALPGDPGDAELLHG